MTLELLRIRYTLAERVHYHHTKVKLSALIIKMVSAALLSGIIEEEDLYKKGFGKEGKKQYLADDGLLHYILSYKKDLERKKKENLQIAQKMAKDLKDRNIYKEVYRGTYLDFKRKGILKNCVDQLRSNWQERYELERKLESLLQLPPGSIIIYCHKGDEGKEAKVKVVVPEKRYGKEMMTLRAFASEEYGEELYKKELKLLRNKYRDLWRISVFLDKKCVKGKEKKFREVKRKLGNACEELFEKPLESWKRTIFRLKALEELPPKEVNEPLMRDLKEEFEEKIPRTNPDKLSSFIEVVEATVQEVVDTRLEK